MPMIIKPKPLVTRQALYTGSHGDGLSTQMPFAQRKYGTGQPDPSFGTIYQLFAGRAVGPKAGYETMKDAIDGARHLSEGAKPSVAIFEFDGRFVGRRVSIDTVDGWGRQLTATSALGFETTSADKLKLFFEGSAGSPDRFAVLTPSRNDTTALPLRALVDGDVQVVWPKWKSEAR